MKKLVKNALNLAAATLGPHRLSSADARLWVLMYHRILPAEDPRFRGEEPGMIVTPQSFRQHMRTIKTLFDVLPLSEWMERRGKGQPLPRRACAVTFDDGWLDNLEYALPILVEEQVPATIFAVSSLVGTRQQFWPNRLAHLLTAAAVDRGHDSFAWLRQLPGYADGALSRDAVAAIIDACKRFTDPQLAERLERMESAANVSPPDAPSLMDWAQLRQVQASGLVEIGSHTRHHYRLTDDLPAPLLYDEVVGSRQQLEEGLGAPVKLFCYPNGDASRAAEELVGRHYAAAVTTRRGINTGSTPAHALSRIGVHEDIGNTARRFEARLSGWV
jgi:peptidoglycan/xylan/chitin deacetylase (PgdA/CDA1 family)